MAGKKKVRGKKRPHAAVAGFAPNTPVPPSIIGERFIELCESSLETMIRTIVREEIRRMLS